MKAKSVLAKGIFTICFIMASVLIAGNAEEIYVSKANGLNSNAGTKEKPLQSIAIAIQKIGLKGGTIHWNQDAAAVVYEKLSLGKMIFENPLIIDGYNNTLIFGFNGEYDRANNLIKPTPESEWEIFHPKNAVRNWNNVTIMDCHNIVLKRIEAWGGNSQTVSINDSYPDIGVKNILLEKCVFKYGAPRTVFTGGHNVEGITIIDCHITGTMYGDVTHTVYWSGGHWNPLYPPWKNIRVINCLIEQAGGRWCMQFNGRFEDVEITGNQFRHGMLGCLSLIGVQGATITGNEFYGSNKQLLVLYDYWWGGYNVLDPKSVYAFCGTHHPNRGITIKRNTFHHSKKWAQDAYHINDPVNYCPIEINNGVHSMDLGNGKKFFEVYGDIYAPKNFVIKKNVIHSINKDGGLIRYWNEAEAAQTWAHGNLVFSSKKDVPRIQFPQSMVDEYGLGKCELPFLESIYPDWYGMNTIAYYNPQQAPTYEFINMMAEPEYNWDDYKSTFNGYSIKAKRLKVGKSYPVAVISNKEADDG